VAGAVRLSLRRALVALGADQVVGLLLEKPVQGVFHSLAHELAQLALYGILVE